MLVWRVCQAASASAKSSAVRIVTSLIPTKPRQCFSQGVAKSISLIGVVPPEATTMIARLPESSP